jgi:hypothetical protein
LLRIEIGSIAATDLIIDAEVISAIECGAAKFLPASDDLSKSRYDASSERVLRRGCGTVPRSIVPA